MFQPWGKINNETGRTEHRNRASRVTRTYLGWTADTAASCSLQQQCQTAEICSTMYYKTGLSLFLLSRSLLSCVCVHARVCFCLCRPALSKCRWKGLAVRASLSGAQISYNLPLPPGKEVGGGEADHCGKKRRVQHRRKMWRRKTIMFFNQSINQGTWSSGLLELQSSASVFPLSDFVHKHLKLPWVSMSALWIRLLASASTIFTSSKYKHTGEGDEEQFDWRRGII